ncbi:MAG: carboxypeptidase M32 [Candidatus Omnitrophota bacterium]
MHPDMQSLKNLLLEIKKIQSIEALLHWDQETYMPEGGGDIRAQHLAYLSCLAHDVQTGDAFRSELKKWVDMQTGEPLPAIGNGDADTRRFLYLVWKDYHDASALPAEFIRERAIHTAKSEQAWQKARKEDDYPAFAPYLEKTIQLKKQEAAYYGYQTTPYDALLDQYEPDMTSEKVEALFGELKPALIDLVRYINHSGVTIDDSPLFRAFDETGQWEFGLRVAKLMGFDLTKGRQDRSAHPFTTSFHPTDVRITTRVSKTFFKSALFATIHETGHALYEQGLNPDDYGTPFGEPISYGIHESQSRLWENLVGRGTMFWHHVYPLLKDTFPKPLKGVKPKDFYRMINTVTPSLIRVEADEVTYSLHIMLRFEIELMLINGNLSVRELPELWNRKMDEYLGIRPDSDKNGVLQDVHWSSGYFGYFPTYALGNLYAAMIMEQAYAEMPDLDDRINAGDLLPLREWLREHIHRNGRRMSAESLITSLTGKPLSVQPYVNYLENKYKKIYSLPNRKFRKNL